jgi:hypothetical protein
MASFFGPVTYRVVSDASQVVARVELDEGRAPQALVLHLRLPEGRAIQGVTVNGRAHAEFEAERVRVASPPAALEIKARHV